MTPPEGTVRSPVLDCRMIDLPRIVDPRGSLTFVENDVHVPFAIQRVYWLYDVPGGESRGGHAHRDLEQVLVAANGSFLVTVDDGINRRDFSLDRSFRGLLLPRMVWREMSEFSSGSVCLVMASRPYDEADYFRDYNDYLRARALA